MAVKPDAAFVAHIASLKNQEQESGSQAPLAYSISEACRVSSLSRSTIYAHIKNGNLPAGKIGRRVIIQADQFKRFLESGAV